MTPLDPEVQAALDERDALIASLTELVEAQREMLDGFLSHGLDALMFQNLFPTSGCGNNGTARQAARSDHTHC